MLLNSICRWIAKVIVNVFRIIKDGHYTADKEFKYSKVLLKRPLMINSLTEKNAERIAFTLENNYSNEINTEVTIKVNQKIPVSLIQNCDAWVKINKNIEPVINNIQKITNLVVLKNIEYIGSVISRIMSAAQNFLKQLPIRAEKHGKDDYYEMGKIESGELIGANGKKLADTEFYTKNRVATSRKTRLKEKIGTLATHIKDDSKR